MLCAERKELSVADLIKLLQEQPKDAKVWLEDCDGCIGCAYTVAYDASDHSIVIS